MRRNRHTHLLSSTVISGITLFSLVFLNRYDLTLMMLGFVLLQLLMTLTGLILMVLRIFSLLKNRNAFLYYFSGTMQACLCLTGLSLMFFYHDLVKNGLWVFLGLNGLLAAGIFYDIYKPTDGKRNTAGDPGASILIE